MRYAYAPCALALLFVMHNSAVAQNGVDIRYVNVATAEVRSGPSANSQFYATNKLQRGDKVEVVQERPDGWLTIRPPQGSFSYINTRFLEHISPNQPNFVVNLEKVDVPVFIGSEILNQKPSIIGVNLKPGAQVTSIGKTISEDGETLMPIESPHGEYRFLRLEAVTKTPPANVAVVTASRLGDPALGQSSFSPTGPLTPSSAPSANPQPTPDELWRRAMTAQRAGQTADAIRLFNQVSIEAAATNPYMAATAKKWVDYLQYGHQAYGNTGAANLTPVSNSAVGGRTYPLAADPAPGVHLNPPAGSRSVWVDGTTTSVGAGRPAVASTVSGASPQMPPGWVSFHGRLRTAGRAVEGVKTYVIEMEERGYIRPVAYVHAGPGVDLASQVGRIVEVWGPAVYRGDLRTNYITAQRVFAP